MDVADFRLAARSGRLGMALAAAATLLCAATAAFAHHTYAMFDNTRHLSISGTVAKFQWINPHAYVWVYVPSRQNAGKYDLWAFENGSPSVLSQMGWGKDVLKANDKVTVEYAPLRDGKPGGHCLKVTLPDSRSLVCPGPAGLPEQNR
jgi:hypothetical protein